MSLDLGGRLGLAGLIVAFFGIAAFYIWPDKRWVGWLSLIAAGVLLLTWSVLELKQKFGDTRLAFFSSLVIGGALGVGLSWVIWASAHEPKKNNGSHEAEADKSPPAEGTKLVARIDFITPDVMPDMYAPMKGTAVLIGASIVNTGPPSVAGVWRLKVQLANGESFVLEPEVIRGRIILSPSSGQQQIINKSDALYEKTSHTPIPMGGRETGVLWFLAANKETSAMRSAGTKYTLMFEDSYSQKGSAEFVLSAETSSTAYKYIPGLSGNNAPPDQQPRPRMSAEIESIARGEIRTMPGKTSLVLIVTVTNSGPPSIADHWKLRFYVGGKEYQPVMQRIPNQLSLSTATGGSITYHANDALYERSIAQPIPQGGRIIGVLLYFLDIDQKTSMGRDARFDLTFQDALGNEYKAVDRANDLTGPLHFPGLTQ